MLNRVILMGRLTRDPEVRYSQNADGSMAVASFTLAVNRRKSSESEQQTADFIRCVAFRNRAEFAEKYLRQGTKVVIQGSIRTGNYTNKDGQKIYTTDVVIDDIEFAESKAASANGNIHEDDNVSEDGFMNVPDGVEDEGLPFN